MARTLRPGRLSLKVPLHQGQTLASFVSGLAAENGLRSIARFCKAFGIKPDALARGEVEALDVLAALTGEAPHDLRDAGAWPDETGYRLLSERLERNQLRTATHVCPLCIDEDCLAQPHRSPDAAAWARGAWSHAWVGVCSRHELRLVPLPDHHGARVFRQDLAVQLRALEDLTGSLPRIPAAARAVERYIERRLAGTGTPLPVLNDLALADALFVAQYLGSPHQYGEKWPRPSDLEQTQSWADQGLAIAAKGLAATEGRLRDIATTINPHGACEIGLRRVFHSLFDRVESRSGSDMLAIREMLVRIGLEQNLFPFDQVEALCLPLPLRHAQTVESARKRFGISDRILRSIFTELGILSAGHHNQPSNALLVDLSAFTPLLADLKDCLNLVQAASFLGLLPAQLIKLSNQSGIIEPFFTRPSSDLKPLRYFRRSDLTAFLGQVAAGSSRVASAAGLVDIWEAGLKACRQPSEVIAAIHDGRISRTFRTGKIRSLRDILLEVEDVRTVLKEQHDEDLVSAEDCARTISVNILAMRTLMQSGILKSVAGVNPVNQRRQLSTRQADLAEFDRQFVSLSAIRERWGTTAPGMAVALSQAGVAPAFPLHQTMVGIYRQEDVAKAERRLEAVMATRSAKYRKMRRSRSRLPPP